MCRPTQSILDHLSMKGNVTVLEKKNNKKKVLSSISVHFFLFVGTGRLISTIILHVDTTCVCI